MKSDSPVTLKVPVSLQGEYLYNGSLGKLEILDISFNVLYTKTSQIIPANSFLEVRFPLEENGQTIWSKAQVINNSTDGNLTLTLIDTPERSMKKISLFIDSVMTKNAVKMMKGR